MCLFINRRLYAYSGGTLVQAGGCEARIARFGGTLDQFVLETPIQWLKVSPDGHTVLIYGERGTRIWRWRDGFGCEPLLESSNRRDIPGCGFIAVDGAVILLVSKDRILRGLAADDCQLFACNLGSPHAFAPRSFCQLPGNRLALTGSFFGDPADVAITMSLEELSRNPEAVQQAILAKAPVRDRAIDVAVGPCAPGAAVVLRDPEDTEIPDEDEDEDEDRSDVENFAGVYIRELDTGRLVERHPYSGRAGGGAPLTATTKWIVVQAVGGVDMVRRDTGAVRHVPGAILDVWGAQLAIVADGGLGPVTPIDSVV
jgi:hypothetical protein